MIQKIKLKDALVAEALDGDDIPDSDDVTFEITIGDWSRVFRPGRIIYDWWGPPYGNDGVVLQVSEE
jgi:hypothetical protein